MKKFIAISLAALCITCPAWASTAKDSVHFYYVLQNPKFFGPEQAKAWFEIDGLKDEAVEARINDTLRKVYFEPTLLEGGNQIATLRPDTNTPKGFTDYFFWNGQTYGNGWVRFNDSDSLLRLAKADGYYGAGKNLGGFSQEISEGRLAWIGIYTTYFFEEGKVQDRSIDLAFDLRTGKVIPHEYKVHIDPAKRDSLERVLLAKMQNDINNSSGPYHDGKIKTSGPLSDTVTVTMAQIIRHLNGKKDIYSMTISRYFEVAAANGMNATWKPVMYLSFDESVPFFVREEWMKLLQL